MTTIPFNRPFLTGREEGRIAEALLKRKLAGDGDFTKLCHAMLRERFSFPGCLLTTSCTDALELSALLLDIKPGDEVIVPAYTFVSSANAFALRGARIIFADSLADNPNLDPAEVDKLITKKTRAIVPVHYAGVACDMDTLEHIAADRGIALVEDAAQAVASYHRGRPLGGIGRFGALSFHETKNIIAGEGGLFMCRDREDARRAEIVREKGTDRSAFLRGDVDKYGWVELGSSFLPSELIAAFLVSQLEDLDDIQGRRIAAWERYQTNLASTLAGLSVGLPDIPHWATNNAHMFYLVCRSEDERNGLIRHLRERDIHAASHYISLEKSKYFQSQHDGRSLTNSAKFTDRLVRLPLFAELTPAEVDRVSDEVIAFYGQ
jgi:dTDP-4-amino-4,6-dideoxygalactose transaminase